MQFFYTLSILLMTVFISDDVLSADALPLDAKINLSESRSLNKRAFGIHGELLWSPVRLGDPVLSNIYNDVGFQDIRLPGGAAGNHYLSQSSTFGCNKSGSIGKKTKKRIENYNIALSRNNRTFTTDDFLSFVKQAKTDFTLIINVLCDTPENTGKWMEKIRDSGVKITYAEMGSEYYFEEYLWAFPTPSVYIEQARKHAVEVRRVFPDVKIGLDTSSASYRSKYFPEFEEMSKNKRHKRGLEYDKLAAAESFADAFIIHIYSPIGTTRRDKALDEIENDRAYKNAVSHFDGRIMPSMQYLHELSPEKTVWITEWGTAFYGWMRKHQSSFLRTHYNALYVTNALLTYFNIPYVETTHYHNLPHLWSNFKKLKPNSLFHAMKLFKEPVSRSSLISPVQLSGGKNYTSTHWHYDGENPELNSVFFHSDTEGYLLVVNKLDRHYSLRSFTSGDKDIDIKPIGFEQIVPDKSDAATFEQIIKNKKLINNQVAIDIPPYSITRIDVKIEPELAQNNK